MSDRDFEISNQKFKLSKIDAFKQFHIVRRIAPILADLLPALKGAQQIKNIDALPEAEKFDQIAKFVSPIMTGLSKLSDQDAEMVMLSLLSAVEVQQSAGNWAKISTGSMLMVQNFDLPILFQLAGRAFFYNLSGFFAVLPHQS